MEKYQNRPKVDTDDLLWVSTPKVDADNMALTSTFGRCYEPYSRKIKIKKLKIEKY